MLIIQRQENKAEGDLEGLHRLTKSVKAAEVDFNRLVLLTQNGGIPERLRVASGSLSCEGVAPLARALKC